MAATNDDHHTLIRNSNRADNDEPLCKRTKYTNDVCIDLKTLMSYSTDETIEQPIKTKTTNSPTQDTDPGDSGFQDFTSNDGSSSQSKNTTNCDETEQNIKPQTTFATDNHQFNHLNRFDSEEQAQSSNDSQENDLDDIQLQDLNDDNDDSESMISELSCLDSLSDLEDAEKWQSNFGPVSWVQQQITSGSNPRQIIDDLLPNNVIPSNKVDNLTLWKFIVNILSEPPERKKLPHINSIEDVVSLIQKSKNIVILTGAGISVSSGIPDFRSRDGIYARLSFDFPDLPDPQAMFDINYFKKDQRPFYKFAKEIYPGQFLPSISHKFIKQVESNGKLLRNYTQNIDTLEKSANIDRVITCHGSFSTASCTNCKYQVDGSFVKDDIFAQRIPRCPKCPDDTEALCVLKPDIVFFGESLPEEFHDAMSKDKEDCDLLIVIGSSLKVKPVALIPNSIPADVPQILINREHLPHMDSFDVELLGDCDIIIQELCHRLGEGWNNICVNEKLNEIKNTELNELYNELKANASSSEFDGKRRNFVDLIPENSFVRMPERGRYLFKGAEVYSDSDDDSSIEDEDDSTSEDSSSNKLANYPNKPEELNNQESLDGFEDPKNKQNYFNNSSLHSSTIDTNNNS